MKDSVILTKTVEDETLIIPENVGIIPENVGIIIFFKVCAEKLMLQIRPPICKLNKEKYMNKF